mmetsp:Transcript_7906/g.17804  ORF Transcript_7906/g.17804 Transcript_7906/m.17804 type:complete len:359 (+) Transcript_7906:771-1847(+)
MDATPLEIKHNIGLMCKAAFGDGVHQYKRRKKREESKHCAKKRLELESKQEMKSEMWYQSKQEMKLQQEMKRKSDPAIDVADVSALVVAGTSSDDEEDSALNNRIGRKCPCICNSAECASITKARRAMGLEDGKIELPSMDLLQKQGGNLSSKEELNVSILNATIDSLELDIGDVKTKKNRIQCDHYALDIRHRLRRSRGVNYVACKFFTSEGELVAPTQSIEERVAELKILQIIQQRAPASFVTIKLGLIGKGDLVVTKEMLSTIYAGVAHPGDKTTMTTNHNQKTGMKRDFESFVCSVATTDVKTGDTRESACPELDAHSKRSKKEKSHNAVTMPCRVECGLAFLVQACEQATRHG